MPPGGHSVSMVRPGRLYASQGTITGTPAFGVVVGEQDQRLDI
jgi:hypothetical protein